MFPKKHVNLAALATIDLFCIWWRGFVLHTVLHTISGSCGKWEATTKYWTLFLTTQCGSPIDQTRRSFFFFQLGFSQVWSSVSSTVFQCHSNPTCPAEEQESDHSGLRFSRTWRLTASLLLLRILRLSFLLLFHTLNVIPVLWATPLLLQLKGEFIWDVSQTSTLVALGNTCNLKCPLTKVTWGWETASSSANGFFFPFLYFKIKSRVV